MGYAISCPGLELIQRLRFDEAGIVGKKYPIYVIALATEVDDKAITWIEKYARAIHSLTSDAIAFFVFYNTFKFRVYKGRHHFISYEGTMNIFKYDPFINVKNIEMPSYIDRVQMFDYINKEMRSSYSNEAFVSSMTYESDSIARILDINPKDLPCFVFIDDPKGDEYDLLPMGAMDEELFNIFREIVGGFYSQKEVKEYINLSYQLDIANQQRRSLRMPVLYKINVEENLKQFEQRFPFNHLDIASVMLQSGSYQSTAQALFLWIECVFGTEIPTEIKTSIAYRFNRELFASLEEDMSMIRGLLKARSKLLAATRYFAEAFSNGKLSDQDKKGLRNLYRNTLDAIIPKDKKPNKRIRDLDVNEWKSIFEYLLTASENTNKLAEQVELRVNEALEPIQDTINRIDLNNIKKTRMIKLIDSILQENQRRSALFEIQITQYNQNQANIERETQSIQKRVNEIGRPKISPILHRIKRVQRRKIIGQNLIEGAETVLKLIRLGIGG